MIFKFIFYLFSTGWTVTGDCNRKVKSIPQRSNALPLLGGEGRGEGGRSSYLLRAGFPLQFWIFALLLGSLVVHPLQAAESITILPGKFKLSGTAARQSLLVERFKDQ